MSTTFSNWFFVLIVLTLIVFYVVTVIVVVGYCLSCCQHVLLRVRYLTIVQWIASDVGYSRA